MRQICSWQYLYSTPKNVISIEEQSYWVFFKCGKLATGQKLPLLQLQTECCSNWRNGMQESCLQPLLKQDRQVCHNSCIMENFFRYIGPEGWRWMLQHYRRFLVNIQEVSFLCYFYRFVSCFPGLPAYSSNIYSFSSLWWGWILDSYSVIIKLKLFMIQNNVYASYDKEWLKYTSLNPSW